LEGNPLGLFLHGPWGGKCSWIAEISHAIRYLQKVNGRGWENQVVFWVLICPLTTYNPVMGWLEALFSRVIAIRPFPLPGFTLSYRIYLFGLPFSLYSKSLG